MDSLEIRFWMKKQIADISRTLQRPRIKMRNSRYQRSGQVKKYSPEQIFLENIKRANMKWDY